MNKRIIEDTLRIFIITAISGLLLGSVYVITKEPIARAKERALQAAYKEVFSDAESFEPADVDIEAANKELTEQGFDSESFDTISLAKDGSGNTIGYVFQATTSSGFGGEISILVGIKSDGTINCYSVLSESETVSLGKKITEKEFKSQFNNKNVQDFVVTKSGAKADNEIDAISGATISSKAITDEMNACLYYMNEHFVETEVE